MAHLPIKGALKWHARQFNVHKNGGYDIFMRICLFFEVDSAEKATSVESTVKIERGSGNVFEDLGFENAGEEQAKADLARQINFLIKDRGWRQAQAAKALNLTQPKVSLLQRGQLKNFSLEKLMRILTYLNQDIEIVVRDRGFRRKPGDIHVVLA